MSSNELDLGLAPAEPERSDYVVSARKYRPQRFEDLTGQETVARALSKAILDNRVPHALLFSGPRGVGKTTTARILAKALNCANGPTPNPCGKCEHCIGITNGSDMDVVEIDGASNTGVDNIRELIERVNYASFAAIWKIYIIDEVHMLSQGAFNALLKTLEEPPPKVIFVFATTEPRKVPETIRSRCTWYQFGRIGSRNIASRLDYVASHEKLRIKPEEREEILLTVAISAEGGMRDALVTLDQLAALCEGEITLPETRRLLGLVEQGLLANIFEWLISRDIKLLLERVNELASAGQDFERLAKSFCQFLRDLMIVRTVGTNSGLVDATGERLETMARLAATASHEQMLQYTRAFLDLEAEMKTAAQPRVLMEYTFIKLTVLDPVTPLDQLVKRLEKLEKGGAHGAARAEAAPAGAAGRAPAPRPVAPPPAHMASAANAPISGSIAARGIAADSAPGVNAAAGDERALPNATIIHKCDLSDLNGVWQSLLALMSERKRTLTSSLRLCAPGRVEGIYFILALPKTEHALYDKSQIEWTESRKALKQALKEICGRDLEVRVELVEGNAAPAITAGTTATAPTTAIAAVTAREIAPAVGTAPDPASAVPPAPAPALQKTAQTQPATLRDATGMRPQTQTQPVTERAVALGSAPGSAARPSSMTAPEPDWNGGDEEFSAPDDEGWTSMDEGPVFGDEPSSAPAGDMFSEARITPSPVIPPAPATTVSARAAFPQRGLTLSRSEQEQMERASTKPKDRLERMKKDSPDFAKALDLIISSFNGFVTHVDGRPIR